MSQNGQEVRLPNHPRMLIIEVSDWEAAMIVKLRKFEFGEFTIFKKHNQPLRIVVGGSEMLNPETGDEIALDRQEAVG